MKVRSKLPALVAVCLSFGPAARADEPAGGSKPAPVPVTRQDMKQALEDSKRNVPRLPLPPLTEEEKARAAAAPQGERGGSGLGGGIVNNGRMRNYYLSDYGPLGFFGGRPQGGEGRGAGGSPDYAFHTMLFWIVSRGNNCTYCMGHQETKLAAAGLSDDQIAALDSDWTRFNPAQQAAFAFARKLTDEPHAMTDADIAALKKFYDDAQIIDMIHAIAGFNAMNRWTGSLRIPQEEHREYLTPTSPQYAGAVSQVAPIGAEASKSGLVPPAPRQRPALESRAEVEAALKAARERTPRLKLADASKVQADFNLKIDEDPPQWIRLLAASPRSAGGRGLGHLAAIEKGALDPRTKAIIAWVAARNDRAWYALGHARKRLQALGFSDDQIFALDDPETLESPADREVVRFARTIAVDPAQVTDEDFARMRKLFDDKTVAEIVHQVTDAASFDRITEAAGLQLED